MKPTIKYGATTELGHRWNPYIIGFLGAKLICGRRQGYQTESAALKAAKRAAESFRNVNVVQDALAQEL